MSPKVTQNHEHEGIPRADYSGGQVVVNREP